MPHRIRLSALDAALPYFPVTVALECGYLADEGIELEWVSPGNGPWSAQAVMRGDADIALGGIWRPLMYRRRAAIDLLAVAQICHRAPLRLLTRGRPGDFSWDSLTDRTVVIPNGAPSPLLFLRGALANNGVDHCRVQYVSGLAEVEAVEFFLAGMGDYLLSWPPASEWLRSTDNVYVAADLAVTGPPVPWSVCYCTRKFASESGAVPALTRALKRSLTWVADNDPSGIADRLPRYFRDVEPEMAVQSLRELRSSGVWPTTPAIAEADLSWWQGVLQKGGLLDEAVEFPDAVLHAPSYQPRSGKHSVTPHGGRRG